MDRNVLYDDVICVGVELHDDLVKDLKRKAVAPELSRKKPRWLLAPLDATVPIAEKIDETVVACVEELHWVWEGMCEEVDDAFPETVAYHVNQTIGEMRELVDFPVPTGVDVYGYLGRRAERLDEMIRDRGGYECLFVTVRDLDHALEPHWCDK
jgi:hypothetical protein